VKCSAEPNSRINCANRTSKLGLFLNSHQSDSGRTVAHSGYDWLLSIPSMVPMSTRAFGELAARRATRGEVAGARQRISGSAGIHAVVDMVPTACCALYQHGG